MFQLFSSISRTVALKSDVRRYSIARNLFPLGLLNRFRPISSVQQQFSSLTMPAICSGLNIGENGVSIFFESRRFKGHSHWQNIAKTKMAADMAKSTTTNRLVLKIWRVLQKTKEPNPRFNKELSNLLEECAALNIPKDTTNRAIDRGMRQPAPQNVVFGLVGRGGIRLVVELETGMKSKTKNQLNKICAKLGDFGVLDDVEGFQETGIVKVFKDSAAGKAATSTSGMDNENKTTNPPLTLEDAETLAIELECEEVNEAKDTTEGSSAVLFEFICAADTVDHVASGFRSRGYVVHSADSEFTPYPATVKVNEQMKSSVNTLCEKLQEVEGIGRIFDNVLWDDGEEEEE